MTTYDIDTIPLHAVLIDGGTQSRAALNEATIAEYAEAIRNGVELPPVVTFFDGVSFWLADGFHRYHAHHAAGAWEISSEMRDGTCRDAVLYSVRANAAHGLPRTNEDKRHAVMTLLNDAEWAAWSNITIAKACGVSDHFVGVLRKPISDRIGDSPAPPTRTVTRNGTTYEQNTANIGKVQEPVERRVPYFDTIAHAMAAVAQALAIADTSKDTPTGAADADELAALREEIAELKALLTDTLADNEMMGRVFDADDHLTAAMAEVKRHSAIAESAERTLMAKSGEFAEAIRSVKYWKNRAEKAEKLNKTVA